ncbi:hypothetical protein LINPERPRIM_LOCUS32688 [Linum perenne]
MRAWVQIPLLTNILITFC